MKISTILTVIFSDIYNKIRPKASQGELMVVSRMTMLALCVVSILWLPILQNSSDGLLFDYIQSITSYLGPPVVTVFVMGIFWERTNEPVSLFCASVSKSLKISDLPVNILYKI